MTPEQIEGYLKRLDVRYAHDDEPGPNGLFHVRFKTVSYRSTLPPRDKQLQLLVRLMIHGTTFFTSIAVRKSGVRRRLLNLAIGRHKAFRRSVASSKFSRESPTLISSMTNCDVTAW